MDNQENLTRRNFVTAGAAAAAAIAAPAILGAQSKSGTKLPVIGQGEYMYEVEHDWGLANLPASIKLGNCHSVVQDASGFIYLHHTVHKSSPSGHSVVVYDPKGKFVRSWGDMFRDSAHGLHIQKEGSTEYLYFASEKHGLTSKRTLKGEEVWTMGYPQNSPVYQKGPGSTGPGGAAGLNFRPTNIAVDPTTLDFWFGDGYGSNYMFHYKQKTSTSYPELVKVFGGPVPAAPGAAPAGGGQGKGGPGGGGGQGKGGPGGPGAAKGDAVPPPAAVAAAGDAQAKGAPGGGGPGGGGQGKGKGGPPPPPPPLTSTSNPHGNWIDTRDPKNHVLLIADRGNRRILRYTLDDAPIDTAEGTGQFCHFQQRGDLIVVPDLGSRVHIMKGNKIVATFGAPPADAPNPNNLRTTDNRADFRPGIFVAPHGATFDKEGNIFVAEWVEIGRFTKLRRV
ncbi:MAG: hypothetical protein ABI811_15885 [Acidobacteriota bacterium]